MDNMTFDIVTKRTFLNQLRGIAPNDVSHIMQKIEDVLCRDPAPQGNLKKVLTGYKGRVYRLRCGKYRVLYAYADGIVTLLGVDGRDDVYRGEQLVEEHAQVRRDAIPNVADWLQPDLPDTYVAPQSRTPLPRTIDIELLQSLRVPVAYFSVLCDCRTIEDLTAAAIPEDVRDRVFDCVSDPDYDLVLNQPDLVVGDTADLLRFKEGTLLDFLLKLNQEQEAFVKRALTAKGPTLVKGGPGSGKSTIALYRVRAILDLLRGKGIAQPRILFTTYTTTLVASSRQLLQSLLGDAIRYIDVQTADSIARPLVRGDILKAEEQRALLQEVIANLTFAGNDLVRSVQERTVQHLSLDYLLDEINDVIAARQLTSLADYQATTRSGRKLRLNDLQRQAIWTVYEAFIAALDAQFSLTWEVLRGRAAAVVEAGTGRSSYDAVVVDEAQDLNPSSLRMLFLLCREPGHFFVVADANQSIYGNGFRWTDVHAQLQFRGRTGILRTSYRTTTEIGEAAHAYLAGGALDDDAGDRRYIHSGPLPVMRRVATPEEECDLLARFLRQGTHEYRLGMGGGAVLCPNDHECKQVAYRLTKAGIQAEWMKAQTLDLSKPVVKVITLYSAKGLEFPIVALASLGNWSQHDRLDGNEDAEKAARLRRLLYVGMTRAMRALLVIWPAQGASPLLDGFDPRYWSLS